ncbi:PRTRC system protein C [Pseudoduganella sp. R-34]|uniref:PRTRC system protein C n=1 Tax=Pseudoduganella sp. R-34 TaxID=3404062 RepID=UPI003CE7B214
MAIEVSKLSRKFNFNGVDLPDPGASFTPDEVRDIYSNQYPDLATAIVNDPAIDGDVATYSFSRNVGTKG